MRRKQWTEEQTADIRTLKGRGQSHKDVARFLTEKYGERIGEKLVTNYWRQLNGQPPLANAIHSKNARPIKHDRNEGPSLRECCELHLADLHRCHPERAPKGKLVAPPPPSGGYVRVRPAHIASSLTGSSSALCANAGD